MKRYSTMHCTFPHSLIIIKMALTKGSCRKKPRAPLTSPHRSEVTPASQQDEAWGSHNYLSSSLPKRPVPTVLWSNQSLLHICKWREEFGWEGRSQFNIMVCLSRYLNTLSLKSSADYKYSGGHNCKCGIGL